jgi:acyl-CoA synthetase (AMP-forming)/AMP-acid ligase II
LHTLNPRLHADQLAWIIEHAQDRVLCFDLNFLPLVEAVASRVRSVKAFVAMADRAHMPTSSIEGLLCYEDLLAAQDDAYAWPQLDERSASSLCYTSGTTGNPKGVLYSHRSTLLHTYAVALPDSLDVSARDVVLPVVPMFHVNAWGLPYAACMTGAKLVLPGPALDGRSLHALFEDEGVTMSAGVPTVWQGLLAHVEANDLSFTTMRRTVIGGAACPPAMLRTFEEKLDVRVVHAWGMTELSPLGTVCVLKGSQQDLPWDGRASGELMVRGPWIVAEYFNSDGVDPLTDGWFPTGDVASIDADGFMQITDRSKDVIKSGGEWIGSIALENIALEHPGVAMAACIGVPHPKWDERPLLVVMRKPGATPTRESLLALYDGRIARWWTPDDVAFVDSIPLGATGKMLKNRLRETFRDHVLPTE